MNRLELGLILGIAFGLLDVILDYRIEEERRQ